MLPISQFEGSFDPEVTRAMGCAYEKACQALGLSDKHDAMTHMVAAHIIAIAGTGERDPVRLFEAVMQWATRVA